MFRGSTNVPDGEFERSLEQMGLAMGSGHHRLHLPRNHALWLDFPPSQQSSLTTGLFLLREVAGPRTDPARPRSPPRKAWSCPKSACATRPRCAWTMRASRFCCRPARVAAGGRHDRHDQQRQRRRPARFLSHALPARSRRADRGRQCRAGRCRGRYQGALQRLEAGRPGRAVAAQPDPAARTEVRVFTDPGASKFARLDGRRPTTIGPTAMRARRDYLADHARLRDPQHPFPARGGRARCALHQRIGGAARPCSMPRSTPASACVSSTANCALRSRPPSPSRSGSSNMA